MPFDSRDALIAAVTSRGYTGTFIHPVSDQSFFASSPWRTAYGALLPGGVLGASPRAVQDSFSSDSPGAWPLPAMTGAGTTLYLTQFTVYPYTGPVNLTLIDRAAHIGALNATISTTLPITLTAPARLTSTVGYLPYLESYSNATGAPAFTVTYTNSDGVAGRTGTLPATPGIASPTSFNPFTLQAGDVGVSSVQALNVVTPGTSMTSVAVVLARPLLDVNSGLNPLKAIRRNYTQLIDIGTKPFLMLYGRNGSAGVVVGIGSYTVVEG